MANLSINLATQNPKYTTNLASWRFYRDHYEGGKDFAEKGYLFQHIVEGNDSFKRRKQRAIDYRNYPEMVVNIFSSHLMATPPKRTLPKPLEEFEVDVDRRGTNADAFFKKTAIDAMVEGAYFVMVDLPRQPKDNLGDPVEIATEAQRRAYNFRPYLVGYRPQQVLDWHVETENPTRIGQLNWVVIEEEVEIPAQGYTSIQPFVPRSTENRYRVLTPSTWQVWSNYTLLENGERKVTQPTMVESGTHPFGVVPLVPFYNFRAEDMIGVSALKDIAPLASKLFNKQSLLDETEYWCGIPLLMFFTENSNMDQVFLQHNRAIKLEPAARAEYLYAPPEAISAIRETCADLRHDILQLAIKQISRQIDSAQVETAEKKRIDRMEFTSTLEDKAGNLEEGESLVWKLMAKAMGQDESAVTVEYNKKFDPISVSDQITQAMDIRELDIPSQTFMGEFYKSLAKTVLEDNDPDVLKRVESEIDKWVKEGGSKPRDSEEFLRRIKDATRGKPQGEQVQQEEAA